MEQYMPLIWLGIAVVLGIIEVCTSQLVSIWFVIGALVTAICAAIFLDSILWQVVVFLFVSALALVLTKPLVKRLKKFNKTSTNADRNIGKIGRVVVDIDRDKASGMVEVDGERWTARSSDDSVISAGTIVKVESIEGVKLMVTPAGNFESEE